MYQTSPEEPAQTVSKLCHKHSTDSVLLGEYCLQGNKVKGSCAYPFDFIIMLSLINCTVYFVWNLIRPVLFKCSLAYGPTDDYDIHPLRPYTLISTLFDIVVTTTLHAHVSLLCIYLSTLLLLHVKYRTAYILNIIMCLRFMWYISYSWVTHFSCTCCVCMKWCVMTDHLIDVLQVIVDVFSYQNHTPNSRYRGRGGRGKKIESTHEQRFHMVWWITRLLKN